jgi:hypothetical protein
LVTTASFKDGTGSAVDTAIPEDTAVLSGSNGLSGTITFTLAAPDKTVVDTEMVGTGGDGTFTTSNAKVAMQVGTYTWTASFVVSGNKLARDQGGHAEQVTTVDPGLIPTTIALSSSANPSVVGQAVTFTATVSASTGTPTGSVQFVIDGTPSTVGLSNGVAATTASSLSVGSHTIVANYIPTGNFQSSSNTVIQTVTVSAITDGTVLVLSSPLSGQLAPTGIIGIDPSTGTQFPITTGGSFMLPLTVREASDHQLYVVDYSALGTGAVIAVDLNTKQQTRMYTGGNINGPNTLAIVDGSLYVTNVGGSAPTLVKIDIASGVQSLIPINGTVTEPVGLAPTPSGDVRGGFYLADEGPNGAGTISVLNVQTGVLTPLSPPSSQDNLLDHMIDLGLEGSGNLVAFIAGGGSGVIEVNPQTGNQTSLVSGLFSDPSLRGLVVHGGTVDIAHGGTIFVSAYDPSGNLPSRLLAIDPVSGAVRTVAEAGNLSLVTGLTVFTTSGGAATVAPSAPSGWALHAGVAAAVSLSQADLIDLPATGTILASAPVKVPPQFPAVLPSLPAAPSGVTVPKAATDSVFANWDGSLLPEAFPGHLTI